MELLIFTETLSDPNPAMDCACPKRGYVIVANTDGFTWGAGELTNPCYRIISVAGMSDAQAGALLTPEPGDPTTNDRLLRWYYRLNIDDPSLPPTFAAWIADASRASPMITLDLPTATSITVQNPSEPTS